MASDDPTPGNRVRILEGVFLGYEGTFVDNAPLEGWIQVEINVFGRPTIIEMPRDIIEPV